MDRLFRNLVVATRNSDKFREIHDILRGLPLKILSLADFSFVREVEEDQPDLYGNAIKKASQVAEEVGEWVLADDTGLEVEALGGAPGVFSARYSGPGATYESNCRKLLEAMSAIPEARRQARFRTVVSLRTNDGLYCVEGVVRGLIGPTPRGNQGFGYDPVFVLPSGETLAELTLEAKNAISHRGQAVRRMRALLEYLLATG